MESSNRFKAELRRNRLRRGGARGGKITIVTIFAILGLIVMAGYLGNIGQVVTTKVSAQNAADAVAFSSAQWMARGMNAATATNHMIGEVTGLCVVIEALGGPEMDADMSQYTPQNKALDNVMDAIADLAPAPPSPYFTSILREVEQPLVETIHDTMVPKSQDERESKVWATIYDAKLQLKFDVDEWLGIEALSNLLFLIPPPWGYPGAAIAYGAHIAGDIFLLKDGEEWFILLAIEKVVGTGVGSKFKDLLETKFIPALVAHGDFIAGQKSKQPDDDTPPAGGIVSTAANDAVDHLGKTYAVKAFLFPEAARFHMPIQREPGPSLNKGTQSDPDTSEWGNDSPLTLPDTGDFQSKVQDKVDGSRKKITDQITNVTKALALLDQLDADIAKLESQDGVTADERTAFETEKGEIGKARTDEQKDLTTLNEQLKKYDEQQTSTNQAMAAMSQMPSETGNLSAVKADLALTPGQMKRSEERYTQWARATFPYVDSFRAPVLAIFDAQLGRSGAAGFYEKWTNRYTLTKTFQFRSGYRFHGSRTTASWSKDEEPLAIYVMQDAFVKDGARRDRKGHEPWTLSTEAGKQQAEKLFTVIGLTHRDVKPLFSPVIYPSGNKHGATTFAQAVFYNGNEQTPDPINATSDVQAKLGWDTLNWDPNSKAPEWGHRLAHSDKKWPWEILKSDSSNSSSAKVKLNWQAKLMPVTKTRFKGAVTMPMSTDMNANVAEAYALFDQMVTH